MSSVGRRTVAVMAAALASLGAGSSVTASATTQPVAPCSGAECPSLQPTRLAVSQASLNVSQMQLENIQAMASDAVTGEPIRGARIVFATVGGRTLGAAYTDYDGVAALTAPENLGPGTLQELLGGYEAAMVGDGVHAPAGGHGAITVGTDQGPGVPGAPCSVCSDRGLKRDVVPVDWSR
ncbi:hypothetical protein OG204_26795 [Streptomyces sp. NBC_01387]|uniref:hypothetical protein n=1 Tax=unclassified Streptomyces TaxID=2593676 RepID=UPI002024E845|nr:MULTISPECIES: hypothetical protein [unclassified Streptomyces]WSC19713.1 hypothetical protein OIE60_08440 [Streptomyces sp. NBC_01766]WSV53735.1 hypothetical protein OG282_08410 [Streptomyces sp. NBC_01014]